MVLTCQLSVGLQAINISTTGRAVPGLRYARATKGVFATDHAVRIKQEAFADGTMEGGQLGPTSTAKAQRTGGRVAWLR